MIVFFVIIYKIYIPRINAFGCFDDCFNIMGGYFLTLGNKIYSDFFFNHQPGMAYISAFIQIVASPQSIPELILRHRQFVIVFSLISTVILYVRFGYPILLFSLVFETFKFYVFGDRFLAEGISVYLLVYLLGVCFQALNKKFLKKDLIAVPFLCLSVILLREPLIPASLLLFGIYIYLLFKSKKNNVIVPILLLITPIMLFATSIDIRAYYLNLVTINQLVIEASTRAGYIWDLGLSFFYPIYVIGSPESFTFFRSITFTLSIIFLTSLLLYAVYHKTLKGLLLIVFTLFVVNLRPPKASQSFYETFHIAPWFGMLIFITAVLIALIFQKSKFTGGIIATFFLLTLVYGITNRNYFLYDEVKTHEEFFTNYAGIMGAGTTIRNLSNVNDTLFVDGYDELIVWEAKLKSNYKYHWYTSYMPKISIYSDARKHMFLTNPPDFYYGMCLYDAQKNNDKVYEVLLTKYTQLDKEGTKNCILILNEKIKEIDQDKWGKIDRNKYAQPNNPGI